MNKSGRAVTKHEHEAESVKRNVLTIDIGGTNVKLLATGQKEVRKIPSGTTLTPSDMAKKVKAAVTDWDFDAISIGYPGPVIQGRPLRDQKIAGHVQHEDALRLWALDRNEPRRRPRDGLADRSRIRGIILLSAQIGFDIGGRDQADLMAESHERARPMVSRRAGLQSDQARGKGFEETWNLAAPQRLAQDDLSTSVDRVQLEDVLCDIKADRGNLRHDEWLLSGSPTCPFWHV